MRVIIIIIFIIIIFFFCNSDDGIEDFIRNSSESTKLFYFSLNIIDNKKSKLEVGGIDQINKEKERGDGSAGEVVTNGISRTLDLHSRKASVSSSSSLIPYADHNVMNEKCHSVANTADTDVSILNNISSNNKSDNDAIISLKENTKINKENNKMEIIMIETENDRKYLTDTADISHNIINVRSNPLRIHEPEDSTNRSNKGKDMEKEKVRTFILKYYLSQFTSVVVFIMMIENIIKNIVINIIILIITLIIIIVIINIDINRLVLIHFQYFFDYNDNTYNYQHL